MDAKEPKRSSAVCASAAWILKPRKSCSMAPANYASSDCACATKCSGSRCQKRGCKKLKPARTLLPCDSAIWKATRRKTARERNSIPPETFAARTERYEKRTGSRHQAHANLRDDAGDARKTTRRRYLLHARDD